MRHWLRWVPPVLLTAGALGAGVVTWRTETTAPRPATIAYTSPSPGTAVFSVRRVPSVVAEPIAQRRLGENLDGLLAGLPQHTCLVVEGPDLRYGHLAAAPVTPASTTKLLTATAALDRLGADSRFHTAAVATAEPSDGVIAGDLVLVGGGDPILSTADYAGRFQRQPQVYTDLDALAAALQDAGLLAIQGSVVGDETRYDTQRYVDGWPPRYIDQNQTGPLSALAVNDGFASYPSAISPSDPLEAAADPAANAADVLTRLLEARGISVGGEPRAGAAPSGSIEVAGIDSAPLSEIVGQLLMESDNNTAELLLKEVGRSAGDASTAGGASEVEAEIASAGLDAEGIVVDDGSGLSLDDRVTCDLLVDLLQLPQTGTLLADRLPVAGESGTLERRFAGTPLEGGLRAKTGSLNTVSSLAGVVQDDDPPLTFAFVVNVPEPDRVPAAVAGAQERLGEILLSWPRVPDVAVLGPLPVVP